MSLTSTFSSASKNGWFAPNTGVYQLLANSSSNSVVQSDLVTTANANTTLTAAPLYPGNNFTTATRNANNTVTIVNTSVNPQIGAIRVTQSGVQLVADGGRNGNSLFNNGYISGPMGTYYGTIDNQFLGAGLAISQDANVIVATQFTSNLSSSQARIWRKSGNSYIQSNITISPNVSAGLNSGAALNDSGNVLLVTNYFNGAAAIWEYDSNTSTWSETANLSSSNVAQYGRYPYLNNTGNVAIIPSLDQREVVIWKKSGNAWASSAVNLFTTANSNIYATDQRVVFGDNGNILGTTNFVNNNTSYFVIYTTDNTGNYQLSQMIPHPNNLTNTSFGYVADMTPDGNWLVIGYSPTANTFASTRIGIYTNK